MWALAVQVQLEVALELVVQILVLLVEQQLLQLEAVRAEVQLVMVI